MQQMKKQSALTRTHEQGLVALRKQIEFYFERLPGDRFLRRRLEDSRDGFLDLDLFLKFNKVAAITKETKLLAEAIESSDKLELNIAKTKVRPKELPDLDSRFDSRTIYLERFPRSWGRQQIEFLLSPYGKINFIELPTLDGRNLNRGFAFVEFEQVESVLHCIENLDRFKKERKAGGYFQGVDMTNRDLSTLSVDDLKLYGANLDLWCIKKQEWNTYRFEYIEFLEKFQKYRDIDHQMSKWERTDPDFTRGCILRFTGVCKGSSYGVLTALLGRRYPVEYVELDESGTSGFARYATAQGAQSAVLDFQDNLTLHGSCGDTIGYPATDETPVVVNLSYLTGTEEYKKWSELVDARTERQLIRALNEKQVHSRNKRNENKKQKRMQKKKEQVLEKESRKRERDVSERPVQSEEVAPHSKRSKNDIESEVVE